MNEISRCCRLLGVKHGASLEEVKKIYRDLVQVWHPDRFSGNERLAAKAQEQLKEINLAYEYLVSHAFQDGILLEPADDSIAVARPQPDASQTQTTTAETAPAWPDPEAEAGEKIKPRNTFSILLVPIILILAGGEIFFYVRSHRNSSPPITIPVNNNTGTPSPQPNDQARVPATQPEPKPATSASSPGSFAYSKDVLSVLSATNGPDCLEAPYLLSPPFTMKVRTLFTNLPDIRLCYGLGRVIFNWSDHPDELRVHDPRNWNVTPVPANGMVLPNAVHELAWQILPDGMTVSVDGQVRFHNNANYSTVKGYPGLTPPTSLGILQSFILETPTPLEMHTPASRDHGQIPNDILSTMVPEKSNQTTNKPDGLVIWTVADSGNRLMSTQTFKPPFIIRTRAKTDALNLRLYCGDGELIFNWERNLYELRVHDPLGGAQSGIRNQGLISANDWHAVIWEIQNNGMRVLVDGQLRFRNQKDYGKLNARVGIGPALSRVTVDYFQVEKK